MNQVTTIVMILTTGGVWLFFRRKLWKYHLTSRQKDAEEIVETDSEVPNRRLESMETILRKAEELRNIICETSFESQTSDLSLAFLSEAEEDSTEAEADSDHSFYADIAENKPWRLQQLGEIARLTYLSPCNKQLYLSPSNKHFNLSPSNKQFYLSPCNNKLISHSSSDKQTNYSPSGKLINSSSSDKLTLYNQLSYLTPSKLSVPELEWESPGQGWHHINSDRDDSDYGSVDSQTDEDHEISDDNDEWEWDMDDYHPRSFQDSSDFPATSLLAGTS